jgi:hypothetical protein
MSLSQGPRSILALARAEAYHFVPLLEGVSPRPPRFLYSEVVRVVGSTGREVGDDGVSVDGAGLVGAELVVGDAVPTSERDGWLIGAPGFEETEGWTVWFAE